MSSPRSPRLVDSFTAPREVLQEFADMAEEEDIDPFAETASKRQIASRQSDYHNRRFNRHANESADAFQASAEGEEGDVGGYKEAMRLQRLEKEEERVRRAISDKEKQAREEGQSKMDLDKTPPREELEEAQKELAALSTSTKRKRRWDIEEPANSKEEDKENKGEWSKEALEGAAPKKRRSRWDATPADVAGETPGGKRSRWDQAPAAAPGGGHDSNHHECAWLHARGQA